MAKTSQHRKSENVAFTLDENDYSKDATAPQHQTIQQLARSEHLRTVKVEDATPDELRAKIYARQGNLLNAFRQMDNSGDSRISYEEFLVFIPKVLGEAISVEKMQELWRTMDSDMTGEIDIAEFASSKLNATVVSQMGVARLRDQAVDPTMGQKADHQKVGGQFSGLGLSSELAAASGLAAPTVHHKATLKEVPTAQVDDKGMARPESASTVATTPLPPQ